MEILEIEVQKFAGWCGEGGIGPALSLIKNVLSVLRIIVPIGLIIMTVIDIARKVINPDEKDSQKRIMNRIVAAVLVFLLPNIISIVFKIIDTGKGTGNSYDEGMTWISKCWGDL